MKPDSKRTIKRIVRFLAIAFLFMNILAFVHAWKFSHYSTEILKKSDPKNMSNPERIKVLLFGINNPRPRNTATPSRPYQTLTLQSNKKIECWYIQVPHPKGTIILFHGYGGSKSGLIDKSEVFFQMGYNTLLVDFMGSGGSEGCRTGIGFTEAKQVKTCMDHLEQKGEKNIYLFGTSLGAVAILKALDDYPLQPRGIILECPFGTLYKTTCARFSMINAPAFPMAGLLVFWGGLQNGYWGFGHKPLEYAKSVTCPALLLYGEKDDRVSQQETDEIFQHLGGEKYLRTYPLAGHENYLRKYRKEWMGDVGEFLNSIEN